MGDTERDGMLAGLTFAGISITVGIFGGSQLVAYSGAMIGLSLTGISIVFIAIENLYNTLVTKNQEKLK